MRLDEIQIRDPFVLYDPDRGRYHLFGSTDEDIWKGPATGFDTYWSTDLEEWHGPTPAFRSWGRSEGGVVGVGGVEDRHPPFGLHHVPSPCG